MDRIIPCNKCHISKPLTEYYDSCIYQNFTRGVCKQCVRSRANANLKKPERVKYFASDEGKKENRAKAKRHYYKAPARKLARVQAYNAVKDGLLVRPNICQSCQQNVFTESHHDDYNKPLEVRWLCKRCHADWHNNNKPIYINR